MRHVTEVRRATIGRAPVRAAWVVSLLVLAALALLTSRAAAAPGPQAFGLGTTYRALINPGSPPTNFEAPSFDDSGWPQLDAPFGFNEAFCGFPAVTTAFPLGSTGYFRKSFNLPANAFGVHLLGTVDNDADVWVNGHAQGGHIDSGSCEENAIDLHVPNSDLNHGGSNVAAFKIVDDGSTTSYFALQATYGVLAFGQQPGETQKGVAITPAPTVQITDAEGGPVSGKNVTIALQTIQGSGSLSGTTMVATDVSGVAEFSNLKVSASGTYRLVASSEGASATSDAFVIADQVTPCNGQCSAEGTQGGTKTQAATTTQNGSLAVSVFTSTPPSGVCTGLVPLGAGTFVNILGSGSPFPDFTITWQLDKTLVKQAANPGASKFNICLGAEDLGHPDGVGTTPWKTKDGSNAVGDVDPNFPNIKLFWGILPDCGKKPTGPCVLHRKKTNAGDVVVEFFKPAPWDGRMYGG